MLKILVTGVNGFVGKHLVHELKSRGYEAIGLGHEPEVHPEIKDVVSGYHVCDLTDQAQVDALPLDDIAAIINLAGLAKVGDSFGQDELYHKVNVEVVTRLGERLKALDSKTRLIAISTGAVYESDQPMPLTENSKTTGETSPYAKSKLLMEDAVRDLRKQGLDAVIVRPFNHIGPGQAPGFLLPDLYEKLTAAKESGKPVMVGNLSTKRDYTDVRDIVKGYVDLAVSETLESELYNICSGTSHPGQEILDTLLAELNLEDKVNIEVDQSLIRPTDPPDLYGSNERLVEETGWEPEIPFATTIKDFIANKK